MYLYRLLFLVLFITIYFTGLSQNRTANLKPLENYVHNHENEKKLIENKGQWPKGVLFQTKMDGGKLWIQQRKMIFHLQDYSSMHRAHAAKDSSFKSDIVRETLVHLNFVGSNETNNIQKINPTKYYFNYFKGNDSSKWASDVRGYESAILKDFYNGIDLKVIGQSDEVKYEFYVQPGINPNVIKLNYAGQKSISIDSKGNLIIETELGKIIEQKPYAYQLSNGKEKRVKCKFNLDGDNLSFELGNYDEDKILIIDPVLIFATYNGANSDNFGMTATYGNDGTAYSGGTVYGNDYPNPDPLAYDINSNFTVLNASYGITDVFISKYSADGTQMIWGTFIGGGNNNQGTETVHSMICDAQDNLYFFGATSSSDFPVTTGAFDGAFNGGNTTYLTNFYFNGVYFQNLGTDIYVSKLSSNGHNLMGSTFVGGSGNDGVNYEQTLLPYDLITDYVGLNSNYGDQSRGEIMLDGNNNIIIASCTRSTNFPTVSPFQGTFGGVQDGVVFKLNANFSNLLFSSYYGGSARDACYSIKVDNAQNVVFAGGTQSNNLPGIAGGTWQTTFAGGSADGFVVKLPAAGNSITAASYAGKGGYDQIFFVEIDRLDNIFVLGQSVGSNANGYMPITNASYFNGNSSNFIVKFNPLLNTILNSTRFGNNSSAIHISPAAFLVDNCGNIYVSGWGANILQSFPPTPLSGMPVTSDAFQSIPPNGFDFYLFVLKGNFNSILYGSYLGGNEADEHVDGGTSRFDKNGVVYQSVCGGCGGFSDFPTTPGAWSATNESSNCNNIIFKFSTGLIPVADFTADQTQGCNDFTVTFDNFSTEDDTYLWDFGDGNVDSITFNPVITYTESGTYTVNLYVTDSICLLTDTAKIVINVYDSIILNVPSPMIGCNNQPLTLTANTFGTATTFIWSTSSNLSNPLNNPSDSTIIIQPTQPGTYYVEASNGFCSKRDTVQVLFFPPASANLLPDITIGCLPLTVTFTNLSQNEDSIQWNFGDGPSGVNLNDSTHTFNTPGGYSVLLIASDSICLSPDTASVNITILDTINLYTLSPVFVCNNDPYTMTAETYGSANNFIWSASPDFSNPLNDNPSDSNIVVTNNGTYYVSASNGYCSDTDSATITFNSPPQVSFTALTPTGCSPLSVTFDNTSSQSDDFQWNFGNGIIDSVNFEPTIIYSIPGTYQVQLILSDPTCPVSDTALFDVTVYGNPQISLSDSEVVCNQSSTILSAGIPITNYIYVWSSSSTFTDVLNTNNSPDLLITNSGNYYLSVSDNGCEIQDSIFVNFISVPQASFTIDDTIGCIPLTVNFNYTPNVNSEFVWDFGNGFLDSTNLNPSFTFTSSGDYQVSLIASETICSFSDTAATVITVLPQILVSQNDTIGLCVSVPIQFSPTFSGNPTEFIWSSNSSFSDTLNANLSQSDLLVNDPQPGYYFVLSSNGECSQIDSVLVQFVSADLTLSLSNSICVGESATVTANNSNPLVTFEYNWTPSSIIINPSNSNQVEVNPTSSQYFYLSATSSNGCFIQDSIFINVSYIDPTLVVASSSEYNVLPGTTVVLSGTPNGLNAYSWTPTLGLTTPNSQTTNATVEENIVYTLTVSDGVCSKKDTVEIKVFQLICSGQYLFIPNAFSPNGDNFNDILYLRGHNIEKMIFRIFDRWGELVFESTDKEIGWDGTFRGKKLDPDVYDYYLDITCVGGLNEVIKGNVTLMK
jgi:gliding motility-associated-like protein